MAYTTVGINVKVEGGKEFQSEMKAAAAKARLLDTELKNLVSSLDGSESSIGNAKEAINGYEQKISNCQTVIDRYNEELKRQKTSQDGTKESIANCQRTIANWTAEQNKAQKALNNLNKYLKENSTEITSNKQKLEQLDSKLKENTTALKNNQVQLSNNKNNVKLLTEQRKLLEYRSNLLNQKEEALKEKLKLTSDAFGENSAEVKEVEQQYRDLSTEIVTNTEKLKSNYNQIVENTNGFTQMGASMQTLGESLSTIGKKLSSIGTKLTATVTTALVGVGTSAISAASDVQQYRNQFSALLGDSEKANSLWEDLQEYGIKSPFDVTGLADSAKQLMGFGFSAEDTYDTLKTLGNVAMGDADHLYNIARAYGQITSQGKISKRYLNAMVNNDFSPYLALADYLGTSAEEVQSILSDTNQTKITVETLQKAIKASAEEGGRYYGMLDAMNNTLKGQLANLKEAIWAIGAKFGGYFLEPLKNIVSKAAEVAEKVGEWDEAQVKTAVSAGAMIAAIGPILLITGKITEGVGGMLTAYGKFTSKIGSLGNIVSKTLGGGSVCVNDLQGFEKTFYKVFSGSVNVVNTFKDKIKGLGSIFSSVKGFNFKDFNLKETITSAFQTKIENSPLVQGLSKFKKTFSASNAQLMSEMSEHWAGLKSGWSNAFDTIKNAGSNLFKDLKDVGLAFTDVMKSNWYDFKTKGSEIFNDLFSNVGTSASNFSQSIKNRFTDIKDAFQRIDTTSFTSNFSRMKTDFQETCINSKKLAKSFASSIKKYFNPEGENDFSHNMARMRSDIKQTFANSKDLAKSTAHAIKKYFNPEGENDFAHNMSRMRSDVKQTFINSKDLAKSARHAIKEYFDPEGENDFSHNMARMQSDAQITASNIGNAFSNIKNKIKNEFTKIADITSSTMSATHESFVYNTNRMQTNAQQTGKNIVDIFKNIGSKMKNALIPSEGQLSGFQKLELDIQRIFSNIQNLGQSFFDKFLSKPINWVKSVGSTIGTFVKETFTNMFDFVKVTALNCAVFIKNTFNTAFDAVKTVGNTLKEHLTTIFGGIKSAASTAGSFISKTFGSIKTYMSAINFSGIFGTITDAVSTAGNASFKIVKTIFSKVAKLFMSLFAPALIITAIVGLVGIIGIKFSEQVHNISTKISEEGPQIVQAFCEGIQSKIMNVMYLGSQIIVDFLSGITSCIPGVLEGAGKILEEFAVGMKNNFPRVLSAVIELITTLVTGLANNLHYIVEFASTLVLGLVNGIVENLPQLIQAAVDIILALFNALVTNLPTLIEAAVQMVEALIQGLIDNLDLIIDGAFQIITTIVTTLIEHGPEILAAGADLIWALIEGLGSLAVELWNKVCEIGGGIIDGIWEGIQGKATELWENLKTWCNDNILQPIKDFLHINSPSEDTTEMGEYLSDGISEGLDNREEKLSTKIGKWAGNVIQWIKDVFTSDDTTETVKIDIDFSQAEQDAQEGLENIKTIVATKYAEINELFKTANTTIVTDTKTQYEELSSVAVTTVTKMVTDMVAALSVLKKSFNGLFDNLTTDCIKQVSLLTAGVIAEYNLLNTQSTKVLTTTLQTAIMKFTLIKEQSLAIVRQMITLIVAAIGKLPTQFNAIGQKMMSELKKGITNSKQQVIDETSALVKKLVDVFIEGLGIHSPARKMVWIGEMMIAGLMKGLSNAQLMKFTSNTVEKLEDAFANGNLSIGSTIDLLKSGGVDALIEYLNTKSSSGSKNTASASSVYPLEGGPYDITSWFGARPASDTNGIGSTNHGGIDIGAGLGTLIKSMASGTVTLAGYNGGYGNCVIVDHGNGLESLYGHMNSIAATVGQKVSAGQSIGQVGSTGNSTGPHLHFEVRQNGTKIDPLPYLEGSAVVSGNTLASALSMAKTLMEGGMTKEQINAMGSNIGVSTTSLSGFYADNATVTSWISQAMALTGEAASSLNYLLAAVKGESNGNPYAINDWDSNAAAGTPSKGIMQTIQPTFDAYKIPGLDDIFNPVHNIAAAIRYMRARYGSVAACCIPRMNGWYGYKVGTRKVPYDMLAEIHQGEAILPANQNPYSESGGDYLSAIVAKVLNKATDIANKNVGYVVATNADRSGILNTRVSSDMSKEAEERRLERIVNVTAQGMAVPSKNETNYQITQNFDTHNPTPSEIARSTKNMIRKLNR